jgi:N-methylhydantoinase B/oxoprolinase/acetone carboxylase alpha subunit
MEQHNDSDKGLMECIDTGSGGNGKNDGSEAVDTNHCRSLSFHLHPIEY